jgi:hypothetical protein
MIDSISDVRIREHARHAATKQRPTAARQRLTNLVRSTYGVLHRGCKLGTSGLALGIELCHSSYLWRHPRVQQCCAIRSGNSGANRTWCSDICLLRGVPWYFED